MNIIEAHYGPKDVTLIIQNLTKNNWLYTKVNNGIFGDPTPGMPKRLTIKWEENSVVQEKSWVEHAICSLPLPKHRKLGVFYSNNNNPDTHNTIQLALDKIAIAAKDKADILTCVWFNIKDNPFPEILSWYKESSHLTQILQILQLLYSIGKDTYDYVSFLEHDCLYSKGYFDYPDFKGAICNMNYIGLSKDGWQNNNNYDMPFSQVTMDFDSAIKHFENILPNAIARNDGMIEPQDITKWSAPNPNVHVNHGYHFTSHFTTYSKPLNNSENYYWGHYQQYSNLFK